MKIKICGLANKENISFITELKPDFIGFIFYERSPRYVLPKIDAEFVGSISKDIIKVGVFVNASTPFIFENAVKFDLQAIQLHGNETPGQCLELQQKGYQVIKAFGVDDQFDFDVMKPYEQVCDYFLFDTKSPQHGGTGVSFDWEILKNYSLDKPFLLGGGIGLLELEQVLSLSLPQMIAVDMNSRLETAPGIKNIDAVKIAIQKIRNIS